MTYRRDADILRLFSGSWRQGLSCFIVLLGITATFSFDANLRRPPCLWHSSSRHSQNNLAKRRHCSRSFQSALVLNLLQQPEWRSDDSQQGKREQRRQQDPNAVDFFIRPALPGDVGRASEILADGFFKYNTNFITYQWERFKTFLSLESTFPRPKTWHQLFVACDVKTGCVLGLAELDAREDTLRRTGGQQEENAATLSSVNLVGRDAIHGPYMCNVAVDETCQRRGIASALVRQCEEQVQRWNRHSGGSIACSLHLKTRSTNEAAIRMYSKLGYTTLRQEQDDKTGDTLLVMRKTLPRSTNGLVANERRQTESSMEVPASKANMSFKTSKMESTSSFLDFRRTIQRLA